MKRASAHRCHDCCGPKKGPSREAALIQVTHLKDELGAAVAAAALDQGEDPLGALVAWDMTARLRWRADHLEAQLRRLDVVPQVHEFPGVSDPGRWLAQIEAVKQARRNTEEDAA